MFNPIETLLNRSIQITIPAIIFAKELPFSFITERRLPVKTTPMRAFLILIAINAISSIYINQAKHGHQTNSKTLSHSKRDHFPTRRATFSYRFRSYSDDSDKKKVPAKKHESSKSSRKMKKSQKARDNSSKKRSDKDKSAKKNEKSLKDEDYFLYYEDKVNNVKYYYPKSAVPAKDINEQEAAFFKDMGGYEGLVKFVGILVNDHMMKNPKMKSECEFLGPSLAKDMVDYFVRIATTDAYDLKNLTEAFNQSRLLTRVDFNEMARMIILTAREAGMNNISVPGLTNRFESTRAGLALP
jgi:hypothetical protein